MSTLRATDVGGRYGGEEILAVLHRCELDGAAMLGERWRSEIEIFPFASPDGREIPVTISLGVASYPTDALAPDALIRCADRAMYIAKARGKNQAQLYGSNRRAHRRVKVEVEGELRTLKDEGLAFSTLDISERGLRFRVKEPLELNSIVEFVLTLPGHSQDIKAYGRVVRIDQVADGDHEVVLYIVDIDSREYLALTRYLHAQSPANEAESEPD